MNQLLEKYIGNTWGKLWALEFLDFETDWGFMTRSLFPKPIILPPQVCIDRSFSKHQIISSLKACSSDLFAFCEKYCGYYRDTEHHKDFRRFLLRWSSPQDWNGEVDTHVTRTVDVEVNDHAMPTPSSIKQICEVLAVEIARLFDDCHRSQTVWVVPELNLNTLLTLTEHPSMESDQLLYMDSGFWGYHTADELNFFTRTRRFMKYDTQVSLSYRSLSTVHKQVKQLCGLENSKLQYEIGVNRNNELFLFQVREFSKSIDSWFHYTDDEIDQYKSIWYSHVTLHKTRYRHFGITPPDWIVAKCYLCDNYQELAELDLQEDDGYFAYVHKCGSMWAWGWDISDVPYPKWKLLGYIGAWNIALSHNHTRYIMESLRNWWVSFVGPREGVVETMWFWSARNEYIKLHWLSDGFNMLWKIV